MPRTSLKTKLLLAKWRNLGALYDFNVEYNPGAQFFLATFMHRVYNYHDQREFHLDRDPVEVIERIEKIRGDGVP